MCLAVHNTVLFYVTAILMFFLLNVTHAEGQRSEPHRLLY